MRMLQALVIFMAVLIFIAMGFLVYGLMTRVDVAEEDDTPRPAVSVRGFGNVDVALPTGAAVTSMTIGEGRLVVHVRLRDGGDEIRFFDLASGEPLGTLRLSPAP